MVLVVVDEIGEGFFKGLRHVKLLYDSTDHHSICEEVLLWLIRFGFLTVARQKSAEVNID